jgi:ribosomal protein S18 acetylase RimI-like enzyme
MTRRPTEDATVSLVGAMTTELYEFLGQGWPAVDREVFGKAVDWTSHPVVVVARRGRTVVGIASGEVVAGMARLHDLMVRAEDRGEGLGGRLVEAFCAHAADLGAARCFLRSPATDRHRRFYERMRFTVVARIPRYYHGHDFLEYLREPLR